MNSFFESFQKHSIEFFFLNICCCYRNCLCHDWPADKNSSHTSSSEKVSRFQLSKALCSAKKDACFSFFKGQPQNSDIHSSEQEINTHTHTQDKISCTASCTASALIWDKQVRWMSVLILEEGKKCGENNGER